MAHECEPNSTETQQAHGPSRRQQWVLIHSFMVTKIPLSLIEPSGSRASLVRGPHRVLVQREIFKDFYWNFAGSPNPLALRHIF